MSATDSGTPALPGVLSKRHEGAMVATRPVMSGGVLAVLTGIALIVSISESMLVPALPTIQADYGTTPAAVSWVSAIYLLTGAVSLPVFGKLGDIYGKKRILFVVMIVYSAAITFNGFTWNLETLIVSRAVQGLGYSMFPLAFSLIHDELPSARVPLATSLLSGMNGVGGAIGLVAGAAITASVGWAVNFRLLAPAAWALTILVFLLVRESPERHPQAIDYPGVAFFTIGVSALLVGVTQGGEVGWTSPGTIALFFTALVFLVVFVFRERRTKQPLINFQLPRSRDMLKINFEMFVAGTCLYLGFLAVIYFAQGPPPGFGLEVNEAAIILLPASVSMLFFAPFAGWQVRRIGTRFPAFLGLTLLTVGFLSLLALHVTAVQVAIGTLIILGGVATLFTCLVNSILMLTPGDQVGSQTATITVFQLVGQSIGAAFAGAALTALIDPITMHPSAQAYAIVCALGVVLAATGMVFAFLTPNLKVKEAEAAPQARSIAEP